MTIIDEIYWAPAGHVFGAQDGTLYFPDGDTFVDPSNNVYAPNQLIVAGNVFTAGVGGVGFFGASVGQQTATDLPEVIAALKTYGLLAP